MADLARFVLQTSPNDTKKSFLLGIVEVEENNRETKDS